MRERGARKKIKSRITQEKGKEGDTVVDSYSKNKILAQRFLMSGEHQVHLLVLNVKAPYCGYNSRQGYRHTVCPVQEVSATLQAKNNKSKQAILMIFFLEVTCLL